MKFINKRLRKGWKIAGAALLACIIMGIGIAYVVAATDVTVTIRQSATVNVNQGGSYSLGANLSGTDDNAINATNPNDHTPLAENLTWTSSNLDLVNFVDSTHQTGFNSTVTGSDVQIHGLFAGISTITATYFSKTYNSTGQVTSSTEVASANISAVVPISVTLLDNNGNADISNQVYTVGSIIHVNANTHSSNPIVIEYSNNGIAETTTLANNSATLTVIGGGATTVTVRTADGDGNNSLTYSFNIKGKFEFNDTNIRQTADGIKYFTLDSTPYVEFADETISTNVTNPANAGLTYRSSDTNIFTAAANGTVKGVYAGNAKYRAGILSSDVGGNDLWISHDEITVVTPFKWNNRTENMNVSDKFQLKTSGKPSELTWTTSDNAVLTVDQNGLVTAQGKGTATITASRSQDPADQTNKFGQTYVLSMSINVIDSFGLSTTSKELNIGDSFDLVALNTNSDATSTITFTVVNQAEVGQVAPTETLVTTVQDGNKLTVTGVASGIVKITAVQNINGLIKTAECFVYVRTPVGSISINPATIQINRGDTGVVQLLFNPSQPFNDAVLWTTSDPSVATVVGDSATATITGVSGGTATITVITMDGLKTASCDVSIREPATGVVLNETTVESTMAIGNFQMVASVLPAGNGVNRDVTWSTSDTSIITVDANGLVTFVAPGFATVICKTVDGSYIATCNFHISIPVTTLTLDYTDEIMSKGDRLRITAEVLPVTASNRAVMWTSSNTNVCTVDSNGLVIAVGTGSCTILCQTLDGGVSAMCNIYVKQPATSVVLNTNEITVRKGTNFWLNATVLPENADNKIIAWTSTDEDIVTVESDGKVTAVDSGIASIVATNVDTGLTAYCVVTVTQPVTGISLNSSYQELWVGSKYAIIPYVEPWDADNKNVTYVSSDKDVATVDENGVVTAVKGGSCIILVTTEECQLTATCNIDVKEYVSTIELSETEKFMNIGTTSYLTATVGSETATNKGVLWTTSNPAAIAVDGEGNLAAVGLGTSVVTATAADGSGVSASCVVRSVEPVLAISIVPDTLRLLVGESGKLKAYLAPTTASIVDVSWSSSDEKIATVDETGEVFALSLGKCKITATSKDGNNVKAEAWVYVTPVIPITSLKINSSEITMLTGKSRTLSTIVTPTTTTEKVSWYSTDTSIVTVDENGTITTVGPGNASVMAIGGTTNISAECIVHSVGLSATNITLEQYDGFDLAVIGLNETVAWRTSNPRVATVDATGHVVARMAGTTTITATTDSKTMVCVVTVTNINR